MSCSLHSSNRDYIGICDMSCSLDSVKEVHVGGYIGLLRGILEIKTIANMGVMYN